MAQDLSQTIQQGLAQTLTDLLGIDTKYKETTTVDKRDIQNSQLLEVNAEFKFDKLTSMFQFFIPAKSASLIFNTMLGAPDDEILHTVDDDTADAMGEFISNVSGSLVTAFNAQEIGDLGQSKFNIQHKEILEGSSIENIENMFRFLIDLDDLAIELFIHFEEAFLPFIEEITKSETTYYPEENIPSVEEEEIDDSPVESEAAEETTSNETLNENEIKIQDNSMEDIKQTNEQSVESTDDSTNENENEKQEDDQSSKKSKKTKLIIIIASSVLAIILLIIVSLFLFGEEKEEEAPPKIEQSSEENGTKKQDELKITQTKTLKKVNFNIKDIDIARLNERLAPLTKYNVLTKEQLELQKKEKEEQIQNLEKEFIEFAKQNKEEPIVLPQDKPQENLKEIVHKNNIDTKTVANTPKETEALSKDLQSKKQNNQVVISNKSSESTTPKELLFITTHNIKYKLFKTLIPKSNSKTARISICTDNTGKTTIFIGPLETEDILNNVDQLIQNSNQNISTTKENYSMEEYRKRCNF
jgi:hypothetical protein